MAVLGKSFHPELLSTLRIVEREIQTSSNGPFPEQEMARAGQKGAGKGPNMAACSCCSCSCTTGLWRYLGQLNLSRCSLRSWLGYRARSATPTRAALVVETAAAEKTTTNKDAGCGRSAHSCLESALVAARCPWHQHFNHLQHESEKDGSVHVS
eukprot:s7027_g1.t1